MSARPHDPAPDRDKPETTRVLITVMTYPHVSRSYKEIVCTAGITDTFEWVRLYPIDYRYRPSNQRFRKYQWIDVDLFPRGHQNDSRKESRRPVLEGIRLVGDPLPTDGDWRARRRIVDRVPHCTLGQLRSLYKGDRTSLGVIRPTEVLDLDVTPASELEWKPKWQAQLGQISLFGEQQKPLRKLPYEFRYVFRCEDSRAVQKALIIDWELGALFLKEVARLGSDARAAQSVKHRYLEEMCGKKRDTRFFVGTTLPYNTWLVLGVFWPPLGALDQTALPL